MADVAIKQALVSTVEVTGALPGKFVTESMRRLGVPDFWARASGENVRIGIADSGCGRHRFLSDAVLMARNFVSGEKPDHWQDVNGHGTHVAGIIRSVAPGAQLCIARVLDYLGMGSWTDLAAAMEWLVDQARVNIINLSLGGQSDHPTLRRAIEYAVDKGVLVVVAAGNDGNENLLANTVDYPARYDDVVAVGAINAEAGMEPDVPAGFSSRGPEVDLAAPGLNVLSTLPDGKWGYLSGTSMATPHVTGLTALLWEDWTRRKGRPPLESQLWAYLFSAARMPDGAGVPWDSILGAGVIDLRHLLGPTEPQDRPARVQTLDLWIGKNHMILDGRQVPLLVPPTIVKGRTMLPVREFLEAQGWTVVWDGKNKHVHAERMLS